MEIPMKCRICYYCNREEKFCTWKYDKNEPELPFIEACEEFKFEVLYLIDVLESLVVED